MGQSSSKDAADIEGLRTVVFEKGGKSSLEPLDPEDAVPEGDAFPSNFVRVSKYSNYLVLVVSFTFLDFFRQAANIYFLLIGALQLIPAISTTSGLPTTWGPLAIVYLVSLVREILEERSRREEQRAANEGQRAAVLRPSSAAFEDVAWQDVRVGDVVRVESDSFFPADLILLGAVHGGGGDGADDASAAASDEDAKARRAKMGACHVDTASLDGESNLKKFVAVSPATAQLVQNEADLIRASLRAQLGPSMRDLAKLEGTLTLAAGPEGSILPAGVAPPQITASTKGNATMLLRECKLRNCERVYGICAFTGAQTFIKQQAKKTPAKAVFLSAAINRFVRIMLAVQVALCLAGAIGSTAFSASAGSSQWYLASPFDPVDFILKFFTYAQITSQIIPISLYVSMEMARFAQRLFMEADDDMLHVTSSPDEPNVPCKVRSLQLNDQLGQVTHVFSDKTGTLTRNSFEFRKLTVGGRSYGSGTTEIAVIAARGRAKTKQERDAAAAKDELLQRGLEAMRRPDKVPHVNFLEDEDDADPGRGPGPKTLGSALAAEVAVPGPDGATDVRLRHAEDLDEFIMALVFNSTVDIEPSEPGSKTVKLAGDSSDEVCFAYAASAFGYKLVRRGFSPSGFPTIELEAPPAPGSPRSAPGRSIVRHLLHVNEFNSARGMMSVVIEDPTKAPDAPDRLSLYVKGSDKKVVQSLYAIPDYVAMARSADAEEDEEAARALLAEAQRHASQAVMRERTKEACVSWSEDGFRTLAFARRSMPMSEFIGWLPLLKEARTRGKEAAEAFLSKHPDDEHGANKLKCKAVASATAVLESDLVYHGAVGYEDSLQEGVPDCVARLTDAGIKVIMLTGDKEGTALNIGFGVQMLTNETEILSLTYEGREAAVFGSDSAVEALRPEVEQLRVLAAAFGRGSAACDDVDEEALADGALDQDEGGLDTPGPAAVMPTASDAASARTAESVRVSAAAGPRHGSDIAGGSLMRLGQEPQLQRVIALLSPTRHEDGTVDGIEVRRAATVVAELQAELQRVVGRLQAYMEGTAGSESDSQRLRVDITHFVLSLDAALHAVRFKAGTSKPLALVLDERAMTFFLDWPGYAEIRANPEAFDPARLELQASKRLSLLALMQQCTSIIGARCQPAQKRTVLELFKEEVRGACCVGIGDGANDVEMINAANVGVGIKGVEGNSAANSADYAIGQFRFLQRLLLVHGRWNYRRMCLLILFLFYKNCLFAFVQFIFGADSGWSGQKLYGELANQGFNLFFTGAAVVAVAVLDQDVDQDSAQRFPALYADGRERRLFSPGIAVAWLINAVFEGVVTYLVVLAGMAAVGGPDGYTNSVFELGTVAMCIVVCVANIRLAAETFQHESIMVLCTFVSSALWPGLAFLADAWNFDGTNGVMAKVFGSPSVWLLLPVGILLVMAPVMLAKIIIAMFSPDYATIVRETEFFIRRGQQSLQFAPMVDTPETSRLRSQKSLAPEARRLERADQLFDRGNFFTRATMGVERRIDTAKERLADRALGDEKTAAAAAAAAGGASSSERAAAGMVVVSEGNSRSLALVHRAAERRSKSRGQDGRSASTPAGASQRGGGATSRQPSRGPNRGAAHSSREAMRWAEQEASLILHPIETALEERLRAEERTRLTYPLHFYRSAAMRKRIANLVQQGRIPAEAVGLRPFPDDDVVFGGGADPAAAEQGPATAEEAAAAAGAAPSAGGAAGGAEEPGDAPGWRSLRMAVRLGALAGWLKEKEAAGGSHSPSSDSAAGSGDSDGDERPQSASGFAPGARASAQTPRGRGSGGGHSRSSTSAANVTVRQVRARWRKALVSGRNVRSNFAVDVPGQVDAAKRVEGAVMRAMARAASAGDMSPPAAARGAGHGRGAVSAAAAPALALRDAAPGNASPAPGAALDFERSIVHVQPDVGSLAVTSGSPSHGPRVHPPGMVESGGASASLLGETETA